MIRHTNLGWWTARLSRLTPSPILLLLCGCHLGYHVEIRQTPEIDPATPHPSLAKVCVLRPQTFGALAAFQHYDNGRLVGVSQGKKVYFCYLAHPGRHHLVARSDNDARLTLDLLGGQLYFVQLEVAMGPDSISRVDPRRARKTLEELSYVVAEPTLSDVPHPCHHPVPADPPPGMPPSAVPPPAGKTCPVVITPL